MSTTTFAPVERPIGRWLAVSLAALLVLGVISLCVGERLLDPLTALRALFGSGTTLDVVVVGDGRWPRTVIAAVVGAALGAAGAVSQALTRNPLGSPSVLGLVHAAALAVVTLAWLTDPTPTQLAAAAVLGCVAATAVVLVAGTAGRSAPTPSRLVLAGVGVTGISLAGVQLVLVMDEATFEQVRRWITGSVADRSMDTLWPLLPLLLVGVALAVGLSRALDLLAAGDDMANGLGQRVGRTRVGAGAAVCLLTGAAVAAAGPVVFVGLVVPHLARRLVGTDNRAVVLLCLTLGAALVVLADVIGRRVVPHHELPVGVVTAVIGGPLFVAIAARIGQR